MKQPLDPSHQSIKERLDRAEAPGEDIPESPSARHVMLHRALSLGAKNSLSTGEKPAPLVLALTCGARLEDDDDLAVLLAIAVTQSCPIGDAGLFTAVEEVFGTTVATLVLGVASTSGEKPSADERQNLGDRVSLLTKKVSLGIAAARGVFILNMLRGGAETPSEEEEGQLSRLLENDRILVDSFTEDQHHEWVSQIRQVARESILEARSLLPTQD